MDYMWVGLMFLVIMALTIMLAPVAIPLYCLGKALEAFFPKIFWRLIPNDKPVNNDDGDEDWERHRRGYDRI